MRSPSPGLPPVAPHEIGILLDYPLEDVKAYMAAPDKASLFRVLKAYGTGTGRMLFLPNARNAPDLLALLPRRYALSKLAVA